MGLSNELSRRGMRPTYADPYFQSPGSVPGYASPSQVDSSGYSLSDPDATSTLPDRLGEDVGPTSGSAIAGGRAGSVATNWPGVPDFVGGLGSRPGDDFIGDQQAQKGSPIDYSGGAGPEYLISGLDTGSLYDGEPMPSPRGRYREPQRAARAPVVPQELSNVDDYKQTGSVDDLGRGAPGPTRLPSGMERG